MSLRVFLALALASAWVGCRTIYDLPPGAGAAQSSGSGGAASAQPSAATSASAGSGGHKPVIRCKLDNGADPVALCIQKLVLLAEHQAAFDPKRGVAQSWDHKTFAPDTDGKGQVLHDPRDDARYAASIAEYDLSAARYGDTEANATLDADLVAIAPLVQMELTPPPASYDGDLYRDLRSAAGGLRHLQRNDLADPLDAIAEKYGRAIAGQHYVALGGKDGVIGEPVGGGAGYAPADAATGALALVDLAARHAQDEPQNASAWQADAAAAFDHLSNRARDPQTGLYYSALATSADPGHDATGDTIAQADVQAAVALALLRARELVQKNSMALPALAGYPFEQHAEDAIAAMNPLWDGALSGYVDGYDLGARKPLDHKSTRSNALAFGALRHAVLDGNGPLDKLKAIKLVLTAQLPANSSLLSVTADQNGYYLRVPAGFNFEAETDPRPFSQSFSSAADAFAIDGLSEGWYGLPD